MEMHHIITKSGRGFTLPENMGIKEAEALILFDKEVGNKEDYDFRASYVSSRNYVPSKMYEYLQDIEEARSISGKQAPLFLEMGCGLGRNVLLAGMQGFEAYGIDLRADLVDRGNRFIKKLKADGLVDNSVHAKLFYGNMASQEILKDIKEFWIKGISKKFRMEESEVGAKIEDLTKKGLDFLTDLEYFRIFWKLPPENMKLQRFEVRKIEDKKIIPPFFIENPYEEQGLDVYDIMGKSFGEFTSLYSYSWMGDKSLISQMIKKHGPLFYIWRDKNIRCSHRTSISLFNYLQGRINELRA